MAFHQVGSFFQMYRMLGWKCGRKTAGKIFHKMNNRRYLHCPVPFLSNWMRTGKGRKKEREKRKERVGPGNRGRLKEGFKLPASLWGGGLFPVSLLWESQFWSVAIFFSSFGFIFSDFYGSISVNCCSVMRISGAVLICMTRSHLPTWHWG